MKLSGGRALGEPRRGELWLALTPGQPDDPRQPRPALVVSDDVRNRLTDDLIVLSLFFRGRPGPTRVPLAQGAGGLDHESVAFCEEITTIDRDFLARGPLGACIEQPVMEAVVRAIRRAVGEVVPEP
ncbi:MAG: type II toxin-antitoxin system PemK/MazF family toxin [Candidatus Dormibacteraeota bacterium]|nr:type II toxin-antitoxin system PemK/MazF family toxin [Candidatus Dormibacteraeota bacterium]